MTESKSQADKDREAPKESSETSKAKAKVSEKTDDQKAAEERVAALTTPLLPKDDPTFHVEKFYDPETGDEIEPQWREHDLS